MDSKKRDIELIELAKSGDQSAYTRLMDLYYDNLHAMLNKMMRGSVDVDDVAMQAFHKAFKKLELYKPTFAFSTWLYRIAYNQMIDHIRKYKARSKDLSLDFKVDGEEVDFHLASVDPNPEERLIRKQTKEAVQSLIKQLPTDYRIIIELRYLKELSYEEISKELDIPMGTVKAKLFRARKLLLRIFTLNNLKR